MTRLAIASLKRGWRQVDHAEIDEGAMEAAFPLRGGREVGVAPLSEKARAGGKDLVKRQAGLLQGDGAKEGNIQIRAAPGDHSARAVIQGFHGVEGAKLA